MYLALKRVFNINNGLFTAQQLTYTNESIYSNTVAQNTDVNVTEASESGAIQY